jgi:hypothetical protein
MAGCGTFPRGRGLPARVRVCPACASADSKRSAVPSSYTLRYGSVQREGRAARVVDRRWR